jgi:NAD(P)-dependent dehydrogenase (short-subunit alcohol dehydrogenase family)
VVAGFLAYARCIFFFLFFYSILFISGNVVNISSVSGSRPVWGALPYAMCKAAVDQFTRCTSQGQYIATN